MNGPTIPNGTYTSIAVGNDALDDVVSSFGMLADMAQSFWLISILLFVFAVQLGLKIWHRFRNM